MNNIIVDIKQKALSDHIPIIMDDTLSEIEKRMQAKRPTKILEIGTAVGYSAICFDSFLKENGKIDTIERDEERVKEAIENISQMELENKIMNALKEKERIENNMIKYVNENTKIKIDITSLEKEVEDLQQDFKNYDGFEKSELLIEYEILLEKIEKLKQSPM